MDLRNDGRQIEGRILKKGELPLGCNCHNVCTGLGETPGVLSFYISLKVVGIMLDDGNPQTSALQAGDQLLKICGFSCVGVSGES